MKKVTSFLLALVMVVSLLPGTALTVSADGESAVPAQNDYYSTVIVHETFDDINSGMTKGRLGSVESEHYTTQVSGGARFLTGTMTEGGKNSESALHAFGENFDINKGFEAVFTADFTSLVEGSAGKYAGFGVNVRAVQSCWYVFHADAEGNIYVTQKGNSGADIVRFDTGLDLPATNVEVRIVADDDLNTSVVVNGRYVARFKTPNLSRNNGDYIVLYSSTYERSNDLRINDVTVYDLRVSQAPVADELQAYYTYSNPNINGKLGEKNWAFDADNSKMALLSDEHYLYIGLKTNVNTTSFTINGVKLTANLAAGTVTTADGAWAGTAAKTTGAAEVKIPLKAVLGLDYAPGQKVAFATTFNSFNGAVVLANRAMVSYQGFEDYVKAGTGEVYFEQAGSTVGSLNLKTGDLTSAGATTDKLMQIDTLDADFYKGVDIEFTADFNDLIVPVVPVFDEGYTWTDWDDKWINENSPANWGYTGLNIELRQEPCRRYAFHSDAAGNIYVTQRMTNYKDVVRLDTGLDVGVTGANVRLSSDDSGLTTVYINGTSIGTLVAQDWPCPASGGRGYYRIYNSTIYRDTSASRKNDVALHNMILTQDVPTPVLAEHPLAANENVDATAYLNLVGFQLDGVPVEHAWYTPYNAAGTTGPSAMLGFGWGDGNLYVGGETLADSMVLTLNGKSLRANLRAGTTNAGAVVRSNSGFEWVIPMSELGISGRVLDKELGYKLTLSDNTGTSCLQGMMTLSNRQVLLGDTGRSYTGKDYIQGSGHGHIHFDRADDGYHVTQVGLNDTRCEAGSFGQELYAEVDHTPGAYELTTTLTLNDLPVIKKNFGICGLVFQMWGEDVQSPFALRGDGKGGVIMDVRYHYGEEHLPLDVKLGDTITMKLVVDKKQIPSLYIDGEHVYTFSPLDRRKQSTALLPVSLPNFKVYSANTHRALNDDGTLSAVEVVIHDLLLTQAPYTDPQSVVDAALGQITEESILGTDSAEDVTAMNLPAIVVVDGISTETNVTWTAINKVTGRAASAVDLSTGVVTRDTASLAFDLTATVRYNGAVGSKTFTFQTKGTKPVNGNVGFIVDDATPATGAVTDWNSDQHAYLDTTHNSIVLDQGSSKAFNRITLYDSDKYSRVSQRHLGVFISNDGQNFTKVNGWMLHQSESVYTLYNLNETARYVKIHCYHDDMAVTDEPPTFYNLVANMIKVSNDKYLPGATGAFKYTADYTYANSTDAEQKDMPVFISLADLGATSGQYQKGCADFRFTMGDTVLAHWYNGKDGFYVRVPSVTAKGNATIKAHWGCSSAVNYSDGEAVFEVTYGNVALIDLSKETHDPNGQGTKGQGTGLGTHGRPFTFPNGDVIVVGRQIESDADVAVFRSTDGGHTFNPKPVVAYDDSNYSGRGSGFGGFLWDATGGTQGKGRLYLLAYNGKVGDATDYRMVLMYTDDYGYTWSEPTFLNQPGYDPVQRSKYHKDGVGDAAGIELQNAEAWMQNGTLGKRVITYCDGLALRGRDGAASDAVDYVMLVNVTVYDNPDNLTASQLTEAGKADDLYNATAAIYSTDGGLTWTCSDTLIQCDVTPDRNGEDGCSESSLAQLDDGSLYTFIRGQKAGEYTLYEARSYDGGKTWEKMKYSDVYSSNTAPMMMQTKYNADENAGVNSGYHGDRLLLWSSCTGLGMISYRRTPLHLGISTDNYQSFDKVLDLTFGTSFDTLTEVESRMTQTGIALSPDGRDAFVSWFDHNRLYLTWDEAMFEYVGTVGLLVEDFDQMVSGTKGAWDDFEDSSLKYQGWLADVDGSIFLTDEQSVSGKYSMKVLDENSGAATHAARQIPSMKSGTVGAKLMVPKTNQAEFVMELKTAYNTTHMFLTMAAMYVSPGGSVGIVNADGSKTELATVVAGSWNDYAIEFDANTGKGTLYVNGDAVGQFNMPFVETLIGVTAVYFNQSAGTQDNGDCLYVDDFFATEVAMNRTVEKNDPVQAMLGRFITIIREVITLDGKKVNVLEWGWVPGL